MVGRIVSTTYVFSFTTVRAIKQIVKMLVNTNSAQHTASHFPNRRNVYQFIVNYAENDGKHSLKRNTNLK